jgi:hypothetical protein
MFCTNMIQFYVSLWVDTEIRYALNASPKPYVKPGKEKKKYHQPAAAAKNLLHLTAAINPTKRVKRRRASRRKPQEEAAVFDISYA